MKTPFVIAGCVLVSALAATVYWAWAPDRSRDELDAKYLGATTGYRQVAGTSLRVRASGPEGAPTIIFLHGFGSSLEAWQPWAESLSATYRVVRFDFPGSGLSAPDPTGNYEDARSVDIVRQLMDQMGIAKATIVGNSLGGRIAWKFACEFPSRVSKLVLISPDGFASPGFEYGKPARVPAVLKLMKYFLPKALLRANLAAAYADPARLSDAEVNRYYDLLLAPGNRGAMLARMQQTVLEDPVPLLRRIETPTLLLWGERDGMIPYANSADYVRALPNATLVSFPDLGHVPQEESPAESLKPLQRFLAQ